MSEQLSIFPSTRQKLPAAVARRRSSPIHAGSDKEEDHADLYRPLPVARHKRLNPCVKAFGLGPEGKTCSSCCKLFTKSLGKKYFKCHLRGNSGGSGTDHRAGWPACSKYVERPQTK